MALLWIFGYFVLQIFLKNRWPNGVIPYKLHKSFDDEKRNNIERIFNEFNTLMEGCVKVRWVFLKNIKRTKLSLILNANNIFWIYRPYTDSDKSFTLIEYVKGTSSSAILGYWEKNHYMVYHDLQSAWVVLHELLHAFGIGHTQMRPDRDDYVTINWDNIRKSSHSQYRKMASVAPYGIPYDGRSIMHYKKDAFWKPVRIVIHCIT